MKYNFKKEVHFLDLKSPLSNNPCGLILESLMTRIIFYF
nr:MAG TPA: hypothetical protein [Bacteriophage sp.]